ncbi:MAG: hypothetical protein WKF92_02590 [Pyrinomonadaceae bacterium]
MGQIVIDIPNRLNRRYKIGNEFADDLLQILETAAVRVRNNPRSVSAEDLSDIRAARMARKEEGFVTLEELKAELGI